MNRLRIVVFEPVKPLMPNRDLTAAEIDAIKKQQKFTWTVEMVERPAALDFTTNPNWNILYQGREDTMEKAFEKAREVRNKLAEIELELKDA